MKQNSFSTNFLDRASPKRSDDMWINDQFNNGSARIIPVSHSKILCTSIQNPRAIYLKKNDFDDVSNARELSIFLGISDKKTYFAIDIESIKSASISKDKNSG